MHLILKIIYFTIAFNFSVGLMLQAVPAIQQNGATGGLSYTDNYADEFTTSMSVSTTPTEQTSSGLFNSIIDLLSMSWAKNLQNVMNKYMYGGITVLENIFGPLFDDDTQGAFFSLLSFLKVLIDIGFITLFIYFISGKRLFGGLTN